MSGQATGWVLRHGPQNHAMRAVLLVIADSSNRDGEHAHPGLEALVEGSLYSRATVFRILSRLREEGWVEVEKGHAPGRSTVFRIPGVTGIERSQDATFQTSHLRETCSPTQRSHNVETPKVSSERPKVSSDETPTVYNNGLYLSEGSTAAAAAPRKTAVANGNGHPDVNIGELVKLFVDVSREHGSDPTSPTKEKLAGHLKRLAVKEHKGYRVLRMAVGVLAQENKPPGHLDLVVGDMEREIAGGNNGRKR